MVFLAADGYFNGCSNVQDVQTVVVAVVSFFLGFVTFDYEQRTVLFVLASPRARPDWFVDIKTHDADTWEPDKEGLCGSRLCWTMWVERADRCLLIKYVVTREERP